MWRMANRRQNVKTSATYTHGSVCFEESKPDRADRADLEIGRLAILEIGRFANVENGESAAKLEKE